MRFRGGNTPVLYHLVEGDTPIGALIRGDDGRIRMSLHGFQSADAAVSAAWEAHKGRLAYEGQFEGASPATRREVADTLRLLLVTLRRPAEPEAIPRLGPEEESGLQRLYLGDEEVGAISRIVVDPGPALWSIIVPVAEDAPSVFTMAAARRMWGAVRQAGLQRQMAQWATPARSNHLRLARTIHDLEDAPWQRT